MTQDVTPHQRWVEWEQRRGKGSSLGARSGDGPTHKVKRPIFRGHVSFRECKVSRILQPARRGLVFI